jgi:ornithine lipid ester-linked acyl 2-hydroxylase
MIRPYVEQAIARLTRDGKRAFFDTAPFPWVRRMETEWRAIRGELDELLKEQDAIPNFQDLSEDQRALTQGADWKAFFFYAYGHVAEANCARCPATTRALGRIPGMKTAFFSVLAPGKRIPEHRGPYKGVLRYHLALRIPSPAECGICVGGETRLWEEGSSLIFDDTLPHTAWNDSAARRVVLFVDFVRPLWFPLSMLNRLMIWHISRTPFVTTAVERIRRSQHDAGALLA